MILSIRDTRAVVDVIEPRGYPPLKGGPVGLLDHAERPPHRRKIASRIRADPLDLHWGACRPMNDQHREPSFVRQGHGDAQLRIGQRLARLLPFHYEEVPRALREEDPIDI